MENTVKKSSSNGSHTKQSKRGGASSRLIYIYTGPSREARLRMESPYSRPEASDDQAPVYQEAGGIIIDRLHVSLCPDSGVVRASARRMIRAKEPQSYPLWDRWPQIPLLRLGGLCRLQAHRLRQRLSDRWKPLHLLVVRLLGRGLVRLHGCQDGFTPDRVVGTARIDAGGF